MDTIIKTQDKVRIHVDSWNGDDGSVFLSLMSDFGSASVALTRAEALELSDAIEQIIAEVAA